MRSGQALDLAADRSVILFWWQLRDHIADHGFWKGLKYRLAGLLYRRAYQKARKLAPEFDEAVQRHLHDLGEREKACCASLDEAAEDRGGVEEAARDTHLVDRLRRRNFASVDGVDAAGKLVKIPFCVLDGFEFCHGYGSLFARVAAGGASATVGERPSRD